jgi:hypothetical protein
MVTAFSWKRVYRVPLVLSAITSLGLLFALLGDGIWDAISWLLLAIPLLLLVVLRFCGSSRINGQTPSLDIRESS